MRILYLGNNWVGLQILSWLKEQGEDIVGLVLHPPEKRKYGEEIATAGQVDASHVLDGTHLRSPEVLSKIREMGADIALSVFFGYILRPDLLDLMPAGCINIHPALLPYNRGANPNVWSIVDGTPSGVTIHYIDSGIDTGAIVSRREVEVEVTDTGQSLYRRLEIEAVDLFKATWPSIKANRVLAAPQDTANGTHHSVADLGRIDEIDMDRSYKARELIDIIRARTFPPYPGAYFWDKGKKVYLRLELTKENGGSELADEALGGADDDID